MSDTVSLIFAAEILISCLVVVAGLCWLLNRRNNDFQKLQHEFAKQTAFMHQQASGMADMFLQREIAATQQRAKTSTGEELIDTLVRLRSFWLAAEQKGLKAGGAHPSDQAQIAQALKASRLYAQLKTLAAKPTTESRKAPPSDVTSLDTARDLIDRQKLAIEKIRNDHQIHSDDIRKAADAATSNSEHLLRTIDQLEGELRHTRQLYAQACRGLAVSAEADSTAANLPAISSVPAPVRKPQLFLQEMRDTHQQVSGELQRLRNTNSRQRELILELEQRLSSSPEGHEPDADTQQLIEKLRLQLRDYDTCTVILELESETLRERVSTLSEVIAAEGGITPQPHELISPELAQQHLQTRRNLDKKAYQMMRQVGLATTISQAASALVTFLEEQQLHSVLFVRGLKEHYWLASGGLIDPRIKALLQSIESRNDAPRSDDGNNLMLLFPLCRLHIAGDLLASNEGELVKSFLARTLLIVDLMFNLIDRGSHASTQRNPGQTDEFRQLLSNIDAQHRHLHAETRRIASDHHRELENILKSLPASAAQKVVIEGLLDDFAAEIDLVTQARTGLQKNLKRAAEAIESL